MRHRRPEPATALLLTMLLAALAGCGANVAAAPDAGTVDPLTDSEYLEGVSQQTGEYLGTLVVLPCSVKGGAAGPACDGSRRRFGLLIDGDTTVHQLVAGDAPVRAQLDGGTFIGRRVRVRGIFYPTLDLIRVSEIDQPAR